MEGAAPPEILPFHGLPSFAVVFFKKMGIVAYVVGIKGWISKLLSSRTIGKVRKYQ